MTSFYHVKREYGDLSEEMLFVCIRLTLFYHFFFYKNHGLTRNNDTVSILQRIILKVRKNTMNKIITVTTFTKAYFCRITVHLYRGGENTRIKEMCVLQVKFFGIILLLKKCIALHFEIQNQNQNTLYGKCLPKACL